MSSIVSSIVASIFRREALDFKEATERETIPFRHLSELARNNVRGYELVVHVIDEFD